MWLLLLRILLIRVFRRCLNYSNVRNTACYGHDILLCCAILLSNINVIIVDTQVNRMGNNNSHIHFDQCYQCLIKKNASL